MAEEEQSSGSGFGIEPETLQKINADKDMTLLQEVGSTAGLMKALGTDMHHGINSDEDAERLRQAFGANKFKEVPPKGFWAIVFDNVQDPILILLIVAASVSTALGAGLPEEREHNGWIEGVAIWIAVFAVTFVGSANDYQKDIQFRKLNAQKDIIDVKVIRGGQQTLVKNFDIVCGDIMLLETGDKLVADGVLLETHGLIIDEASLTGESDPIKKLPETDPWCRSGTQVSEGFGKIVVTAVGEYSEWGKTLALVGEAGDDNTPLQDKLEILAANIGKVGMFVAVSCFIVLLIKWCVTNNGFPIAKINDNGPVQFFMYSVTIIVMAIPEGLPLAVTISLAYSMQKMMKDNNFVRVLSACETMGGATAICSDKTGTLTENRMTVTEGWFAGKSYPAVPAASELNPTLLKELEFNIALNSRAFLIKLDNGKTDFVGNRTECALLMLMQGWGEDYAAWRERHEADTVKIFGFSSAKKMASALVKREGKYRLYNKGAAEWVIQRCTTVMTENGSTQPLSDAMREEMMAAVVAMASRGLRCICLAYTDHSPEGKPDSFWDSIDNLDGALTACCIVGIKDPVRKEVPDAVATCQRAGITVRMVTGDNIYTAQHIATECGILAEPGCMAMEGPDFRDRIKMITLLKESKAKLEKKMANEVTAEAKAALKKHEELLEIMYLGGEEMAEGSGIEGQLASCLGDQGYQMTEAEVAERLQRHRELHSMLQQLRVLARSSPEDKFDLVSLLRAQGEVVAVTGDGTNDAPALKVSDVGLAMGIAGTEVAKEAADIVILDDNFSSIVKAVLWGRSVFNNIRKFLQFQLTVNFTALVSAFIGAIVGGRVPLTVLQLLWVNMIMDTLGALALATEDPMPELLLEKPSGRDAPLISRQMWKHILTQGIYQIFVMMFCMYALPSLFERYYDTPTCTYYPDNCIGAAGKLGYDAATSTGLCNGIKYCGFPCKKTDIPSGVSCGTATTAASYYCAGASTCDNLSKYNSLIDKLHNDLEKQWEKDFYKAGAVLFNAFIFCQVFNEINARRINHEYDTLKGVLSSPVFMFVIVTTAGLQAIIINFLGSFFKVVPLDWIEWLCCIATGAFSMLISLASRWVFRQLPDYVPPASTLTNAKTHTSDPEDGGEPVVEGQQGEGAAQVAWSG